MEMRRNLRRLTGVILICLILGILFSTEPTVKTTTKYILSEKEIFGQEAEWELVQNFLPVFGYLLEEQNGDNMYGRYVMNWFPVYRYLSDREVLVKSQEKRGELQIGAELARGILEENVSKEEKEEEEVSKDETKDMTNREGITMAESEGLRDSESIPQNEMVQEKEDADIPVEEVFFTPSDFVPATEKKEEYNWEEYTDITRVRKDFFAIDATTDIEDERINPKVLLEKDISLTEGNGGPQILVYHTHSQESFADSVPENPDTSIVAAGEYLTGLLQDTYGYEVLHHTGEYDVETRDYAYSYALPNIEAILEEYPSIEVVIDLHRDAVAEDKKLVSRQNGRDAAQVMFFNGLSYTKKQGAIGYLENPYIDDNLAFSFQMQVLCNEYYPGLTRRIYLKGYRYNMHLCSKSLLIELGAQTNTCEEAKNTLDMVAHVLDMCLSKEEKTAEESGEGGES